jgi:hypothetical protein
VDLGTGAETVILIAHRGNTNGAFPNLENTRGYIKDAIAAGFDVEIDVWGHEGRLWLGHDLGVMSLSIDYLHDNFDRLWVHCKNIEAIDLIHKHAPRARYFWHQKDDYTITSNGYVWCFPGKVHPTTRGIVVMPELLMPLSRIYELLNNKAYAICSDFVGVLKDHK